MITQTTTYLNTLVDDFMQEIAARTGVGENFLHAARPALQEMFRNTPPDLIEFAKKEFEEKALSFITAEKHLKSTLAKLEEISVARDDATILPDDMERLSFTKAVIVNSLLKTYGGFGQKQRHTC